MEVRVYNKSKSVWLHQYTHYYSINNMTSYPLAWDLEDANNISLDVFAMIGTNYGHVWILCAKLYIMVKVITRGANDYSDISFLSIKFD
ncbi:hypothetical protein ACJX0J_030332 [Zea mays]